MIVHYVPLYLYVSLTFDSPNQDFALYWSTKQPEALICNCRLQFQVRLLGSTKVQEYTDDIYSICMYVVPQTLKLKVGIFYRAFFLLLLVHAY